MTLSIRTAQPVWLDVLEEAYADKTEACVTEEEE